MAPLIRVWILAAGLLAACTTPQPSLPPVLPRLPEVEAPPPETVPEAIVAEKAPPPHESPPALVLRAPVTQAWIPPAFDPEGLSFGWVTVPGWPERTGVSGHFWTTERDFWRALFRADLPLSRRIFPLQARYEQSTDALEKFWAAFYLERAHTDSGLWDSARFWRARAQILVKCDFLALDEIWDLAMIQKNAVEAKEAWRQLRPVYLPLQGDQSRAALLRQSLFLGQIDLRPQGVDPFVSTLALDQDDLWLGTWNGGLVRRSLATGEWLVLDKPKSQIAPVRLVRVSRFFVYVFKEKSFSRYSKVTLGWKEFPYPPDWPGLRIQDVWVEEDEKFWVAHLGQGLWSWTAGQWQAVVGSNAPQFVNAVVSDGQGGLWVGSRDNGLWHWQKDLWSPVSGGPTNVSAMLAPGDGKRTSLWAVGSWGQGLWLFDGRGWNLVSGGREFVTAIDWNGTDPWWGTLDEGLWHGQRFPLQHLGIADGIPDAGISALVSRAGRLYWGTTGQSVGVWSEDDDPMVYR
ncbi:MAG: hypothetical protein WCG80_01865 [Spirochaetales bacterium]